MKKNRKKQKYIFKFGDEKNISFLTKRALLKCANKNSQYRAV